MKNIILIVSLLAVIFGCDNSYLSVKGDRLYFCKESVGEFLSTPQAGVKFSDKVEKIDDNIIKVTRTFVARENIDSVRLTFDFRHAHKCSQAIIPSVCYNGNHWGRGKEPKGFATDGVWHTYSYRRTPIPGATFSEGEKFAVAVWGVKPTNEAEAFSCSMMPDSAAVTLYLWRHQRVAQEAAERYLKRCARTGAPRYGWR